MTGYFATGRHGGKFGYYGCYNKQCASRVTVPKQKVEAEFSDHLHKWQPTPGVMRIVTQVVTQRWESRQDTARFSATHHATTIREIEAKLTKLETAYIYERAIDRDRYDQHRAGLEQQLTAARVAMNDAHTDDLDLEGALRVASRVLTSAATVYATMAPVTRRKFLGVLNPTGWQVERSGAIRTPTEAFVYRCFDAKTMRSRGEWYARSGFEPPAFGSGDRCSIQLSYGRIPRTAARRPSPPASGTEPNFCYYAPFPPAGKQFKRAALKPPPRRPFVTPAVPFIPPARVIPSRTVRSGRVLSPTEGSRDICRAEGRRRTTAILRATIRKEVVLQRGFLPQENAKNV